MNSLNLKFVVSHIFAMCYLYKIVNENSFAMDVIWTTRHSSLYYCFSYIISLSRAAQTSTDTRHTTTLSVLNDENIYNNASLYIYR